jgi:aspartyl-tRNA(Asn)/glutamyl-tRNA(Gln) amidotransferase subunit B
MGDLLRMLKDADLTIEDSPVSPEHLVELVELIASGDISGKIGKRVFEELWTSALGPAAVVEAQGWKQVSDSGALESEIRAVFDANPGQLAAYRGGKTKIFGFFVGQVMKATRGQANPGLVNELLKKLLDE